MKHFITLIIACVVLALALAAYGYGYSRLAAVAAATDAVRAEITQKTQEESHVAQVRAALTSLASDEAAVSAYFLPTSALVPFLGDIEKAGKAFGATVSVASVADDAKGSPHGRITLTLTISGTFDAVMRTVGAIEYGPYDIRLTSLTLTTTSHGTPSVAPQWSAAAVYSIGTVSSSGVSAVRAITLPLSTSTRATSTPFAL